MERVGTASGSPAAGPGSRAPGAAARPDQHVVAAVAVEVAERHERRGGGPAGAGDLGAQRARTGAALDGEGAGGVEGEEAAGFYSHQVPDQLAAPDVTVEAMVRQRGCRNAGRYEVDALLAVGVGDAA